MLYAACRATLARGIAIKSITCLAVLIVTVTACTGRASPNPDALTPILSTSANSIPTPVASVTAITPRASPSRPLVTPSSTITLTVWIAEEVAPGTTPAGRILRNQIDAFSAANRTIRLELVPKKSSGKGGLLDLLITTRSVVPSRLPDMVVIDLAQVPVAAEAGILQPIDDWLAAEVTADLFPFATEGARFQNHWMAVPFAADVQHLVYNRTTVRRVPQTWDDFAKQKATLLLPLGGDDAFLLQYFALGATLKDAANQAAIDGNAAAQVLSFFKRAHDAALIPDGALGLKSVDEVWPSFAAGQVAMAQVSAARYLSERSKLPNALYAPLPTRDGKAASLATGWALAVVTDDPARQAAATQFIQWIVQGERLAPWLRAAHLLPASRTTVPLAVDPPDYASFIRDELEHAAPLPSASTYARQSEAWRAAIAAVWNGQVTPEEGARTAASVK